MPSKRYFWIRGSRIGSLEERDLEKDGQKNDNLAKYCTEKAGIWDGDLGKDVFWKETLKKDG